MEKETGKGRLKKWVRRLGTFVLAAAAAVTLGGCAEQEDTRLQREWVYVPEVVELEDTGAIYAQRRLYGDTAVYVNSGWDKERRVTTQVLCRYSLTDGSTKRTNLVWEDMGETGKNVSEFVLGEDGSLYVIAYDIVRIDRTQEDAPEPPEPDKFLYKFDPEGKELFSRNIMDQLNEDEGNYLRSFTADSEGRLYLNTDTYIWLYDAEGRYQGSISVEDENGSIMGVGQGKDGKMYASWYTKGSGWGSAVLAEIDFDGRKLETSYHDFPSGLGDTLVTGAEEDFIAYNSSYVYSYDCETQTKEQLFGWLECNINGNDVGEIGVLPDGRLAVSYSNWEKKESGYVLLTKTAADQVPQKENLIVAVMHCSMELREAAVEFNKISNKYRVIVNEYIEYGEYDTSEAMTRLYNDISSGNCPDIIELSQLNIRELAAKGICEDLEPYLEKSTVFERSDFLEGVLEVYTIDGVLLSIPSSFAIETVLGSGAELGGRQGWTIEDIIAYADAHPDAELFDREARSDVMEFMMKFNEELFIDWSSGECKFETDTFKSLLAFVKRFPEESADDITSTEARIQNGEVLLYREYLNDLDDVQLYPEIFKGEAAFIGYPTVDGSSGHGLTGSECFAIVSKSRRKEGAWEFIEDLLKRDGNTEKFLRSGLPVVKRKLEKTVKEILNKGYELDENGDPILDEEGNPVKSMNSSTITVTYPDGWTYTYRDTTQEEIDAALDLIERAKPLNETDEEVIRIISEEAEAFYVGQKSVDEVASIIQNRVGNYVEERQ